MVLESTGDICRSEAPAVSKSNYPQDQSTKNYNLKKFSEKTHTAHKRWRQKESAAPSSGQTAFGPFKNVKKIDKKRLRDTNKDCAQADNSRYQLCPKRPLMAEEAFDSLLGKKIAKEHNRTRWTSNFNR